MNKVNAREIQKKDLYGFELERKQEATASSSASFSSSKSRGGSVKVQMTLRTYLVTDYQVRFLYDFYTLYMDM